MTKSQVNKLGKEIRSCLKESKRPSSELLEKLQEYRTSFKSDLSSVFEIISDVAKGARSDSITAFRIKRIESIISKIKRQPTMALGNMGDIAGCRILVYHINAIPKLIDELNKRFTVKYFNDYLKETKDDGYRGYHLYIESPKNPHKLIEIQIRTVKSHKWASMVEIIDILYNLKIKEGQKHPDFERFLLLLSNIDELNFDEKKEIINIDDKYKVHSKFNEVFIKNNAKIRMDWFGHIGKENNYFIIEVDKNKMSNISSFQSYEIAESTYFEKFKLKDKSNFVLTHIEKPNFKRVCIAYASYVLINHDYLNDWYKIAKEILNNLILTNNSDNAKKYKSHIESNLTEQLNLIKNEVQEIREYRKNESHSLDGYEEWLEEIKERLVDEVYSVNEMITSMKENFSFCWYQFNKFWFSYINRWRLELKDLEILAIGMVVVINAVKNKEFSPKKNLRSYRKELMGSDLRGVNAMSVSEITGIPRPTVVRKLKYLIDKKFLHINEKKLITFNAKDSAFQKTGKMVNQNMLALSNFIYRVFNQIKIINS